MINEHDIKDLCNLDKLHEGDKFIVGGDKDNHVFKVKNFTGDYVFCYDHDGIVHHFATWTKVVKL
jgi:hypothetical protein